MTKTCVSRTERESLRYCTSNIATPLLCLKCRRLYFSHHDSFFKLRTDDQVFLDKFPLTSFICSCVRHKLTSFSLTRNLVQKLVMPACDHFVGRQIVANNFVCSICASFQRPFSRNMIWPIVVVPNPSLILLENNCP